ncbi:MAG: integral rane sensor signal transduction histidine kinase [Fibrobacteres bacterium]|nr:integral rane sensor signal transduction histidine kinase [Fibrobacterota bacterium]
MILVPGLILAYLSFRTVKDERILIEKSLENRNEEFLDAVQGVLEKTKAERLARLQDQLQRSSSSSAPDNYLFLATDLLENSLVQSLAIFRREEMVFPRRLAFGDTFAMAMSSPVMAPGSMATGLSAAGSLQDDESGGTDSLDLPPRAQDAIAAIQQEYRLGRYLHTVRMIRTFSHASDSLFSTRAGSLYRYGLWLMEIKCLIALNLTDEAVGRGRELIQALLRGNGFSNYHQVKFYLSETVNLLTSLESLPREIRDYFWSIHQRSEIFLVNAEFVSQEWKASPEYLIRSQALDFQNPIQINYLDGIPYLIIGYPWLDKETRIIARLNESVFNEAIESEILQSKKSAWKSMDFAILSQKDQVVMTTDSLADRKVAMEKNLPGDFPAWKLVIFKMKDSEVIALGRRKLTLLYTLLAFSLAALLIGSYAALQGLKNERKMVRMKSNFLSAVSHELKTPLTAIRMFAEILESGRQTQEDKRKKYATLIGEEAMRLYGMIEGILSFTKLEEKRAKLNFSSLNLTQAVQEVTGLMAGAFDKAGIKLALQLDAECVINGDYDSLRSVVQNLLENALKYSKAGTTVQVALENTQDKAVLRVKDQGIGISSADQKHIFDKFYRAGDEMTRKTKGSGLGLAIVKQILDTHRAQIKVNSKLNEGTEMVITFPKGKHA